MIACRFVAPLLLGLLACGDSAATGDTATTGGASSSGGSSAEGGHAEGGAGAAGGAGGSVNKPAELVSYLTGNDADAKVTPLGPGLVLMGGGADVDAAFSGWVPTLAGGDVVVLRTSGADGYNAYLYEDIGGIDSVETMLVTTVDLANSDYVASRLAGAEGIFLAGGDQATYVAAWKGTRVEEALEAAWSRGAVIGGTSAGCAVLGDFVFTAENDTVYSSEALEDPYNAYMTLDRDFLDFPPLVHVVTDSHFAARDRMGRLIAFLARPITDGWSDEAIGLGIDEATALVVDAAGKGTVVGSGSVYVVRSNGAPTQCVAGSPLDYTGLESVVLSAGDSVTLPSGASTVSATPIGAQGGVTIPADPY